MPRPLFRWLVLIALVFAADLKAASSSISLGASPNPATYGSAVTLTATVSPPDATGKVTFYDGLSVLGIASVSSATASLVTRTLPSGARSLKAYYSGDGSYSPSTSVPVAVNIQTVAGKGFAIGQSGVFSGSYIAIGDFNGDGKIDLVAAPIIEGTTISVALGHGDGTFAAPVAYPVELSPQGIAVGDFNGDGKLDLAVAINSGKIVNILLGVGDGSFGAATEYPVPGEVGNNCVADSISAGDFNQDGKIDLAVGTGCGVGILLGVGDGSFAMGQNFPGASGGIQVLACDLDGNGVADLISVGDFGQFVILLGRGDATFTTGQSDDFGNSLSVPLIAGDFNGDGTIDFAARSSNSIVLRLGNGDGTLGNPIITAGALLVGPYLAAEDFNGDGKRDLANGSFQFPGGLGILFGIGDGTFQEAIAGALGSYFSEPLIAADLNGDGRPDLVTANFLAVLGAPNTGLQLTKTHSGNFQEGQTAATYSIAISNIGPQTISDIVTVKDTLPASLTATSITGTGWGCLLAGLVCSREDAIAANAAYPPITVTVDVATWAPSKVTNFANVALGATGSRPDNYGNDMTLISLGQTISFGPLPDRALGDSPFQVTATASSGLAVTFAASGNCIVSQSTVTLTGVGGCSITASQIGNGTYPPALDVVRSFVIFSIQSSVTLSSSQNPSRLSTPITVTATVTPSNATGAVTFYDGTTILGIKNVSGGIATIGLPFLPTGNRSLRALYGGGGSFAGSQSGTLIQNVHSLSSPGLSIASSQTFTGSGASDIATGDFNGDGKLDIVTVGRGFGVPTVAVQLNHGDGTFTTVTTNVPIGDGNTIRVGDFDGDNKLDLAIADWFFGDPRSQIIILHGYGDGTFDISHVYPADVWSLELGDFNGDGKLDIVYTRYNASRFVIMAGDGQGAFSAVGDFPTSDKACYLAVGDFNGDGRADVATSYVLGNSIDISLGRGDNTFGPSTNFPAGAPSAYIATGDLNGDGKLDLVTAGGASVLLGGGDGTFSAPILNPAILNEVAVIIADFNGDGRSDVAVGKSVFNGAPNISLLLGNGDGTLRSPATYRVDLPNYNGLPALAAGDFNGDGRLDLVAVSGQVTTLLGRLNPSKVGIFRTSFYVTAEDVNGNIAWDAGTDRTGNFGAPGDQIIFGDWDGSGTTKIGLFRPSNGLMALDMNGNLQYDPGIDKIGIFGQPGDVAIVGDWSGDGKTKVGIYRPSTSYFALDTNGDLKLDAGDTTGTFGAPGDVPIVGDWTGNGKTKVGIFRNGTWALDMNGNILFDSGIDTVGGIGQTGDVPLLGDWNGDGRTKVGIYRASQALFGLDYNGNLVWDASDRAGNYGGVGDTPILGDWDGTGVTRIGIYRAGIWALDVNGNIAWDGGIDRVGGFGVPGDLPIVGKWQ